MTTTAKPVVKNQYRGTLTIKKGGSITVQPDGKLVKDAKPVDKGVGGNAA